MSEIIQVIANLSVLVFVVCSMFALGLSLTLKQILDPLRNTGLVIRVLLLNFVLAPLVAYLLQFVIRMDTSLAIGLLLLATAAGAPFLPKLVQSADGDVPMSVGIMVLLMVVTVIYVPLVLPLLLPGVEVNAWGIAQSLIVLMLIPLGIGLLINARYANIATSLTPTMSQAASTAMMLLFATMLLLNYRTVFGAVGTGAIIAALLFIVILFAAGYFLGGSVPGARDVLSLGTAQRNVSAALVVASGNFTDPNVLVMVLVGALLMLVILMPAAGELGKRRAKIAGPAGSVAGS